LFALEPDEDGETEAESSTELVEPVSLPEETTEPAGPVAADRPEPLTYRLEDLPKELGVLLTSVGIMGLILPGIAGAPALIAGGLVLWPKKFRKVENWFESHYPISHRTSMQQVGRFLGDLERRYPLSSKP